MQVETKSHDSFDPASVQRMLLALGDDTVSQLMVHFAADVRRSEADLAGCEAVADFRGIRFAAHSLKGTASMFGAQQLARECAKLEAICNANDIANLRAQVRLARSLCRQVVTDSTQYHHKHCDT